MERRSLKKNQGFIRAIISYTSHQLSTLLESTMLEIFAAVCTYLKLQLLFTSRFLSIQWFLRSMRLFTAQFVEVNSDSYVFSISEWISSLSNDVIHSFQRAAEIGVELKEPWLVCNAAVYLWNYTTHLLSQGRNKEVIPTYSPVLEAMKVTGHAG